VRGYLRYVGRLLDARMTLAEAYQAACGDGGSRPALP